jgi:hypothetical protein
MTAATQKPAPLPPGRRVIDGIGTPIANRQKSA